MSWSTADSGHVAASDRWLIIAQVLQISAAQARAFPERAITDEAWRHICTAIRRRSAGEPLAYIFGEVGFYGHIFHVTPGVLIPRPESEHLVEAVIEYAQARQAESSLTIVDVGTGSGALAISTALALPYAQVIAIDISDDALAVTQMNIQRFAVEQRVQLCRSDLLTALPQQAQPIDVIIANLPYIPTLDIPAKT